MTMLNGSRLKRPRQKQARPVRLNLKVLLTVFFYYNDVVSWGFARHCSSHTVTSSYFLYGKMESCWATLLTGVIPLQLFPVSKTERTHEKTEICYHWGDKEKNAYQKYFKYWRNCWHKSIISDGG